jgi:hypothetical protein
VHTSLDHKSDDLNVVVQLIDFANTCQLRLPMVNENIIKNYSSRGILYGPFQSGYFIVDDYEGCRADQKRLDTSGTFLAHLRGAYAITWRPSSFVSRARFVTAGAIDPKLCT